MTLTWQQMKDYILEGLLKDEIDSETSLPTSYTENQLLAYGRWACAELSQHTAQADSFTYEMDGNTHVLPLPTDMIGSLDATGKIACDNGSTIQWLSPYTTQPGLMWPTKTGHTGPDASVYWEWPSGHLTLGFVPAKGTKITLYFFKIWDAPVKDEDYMSFPQWMEQPFAYLFSAMALEPVGTQFARIRGWNRKQDSGNPEHNPAQKQAKWFVEQAYRLLMKIPVQDRSHFYLNNPRLPGR